VDEKGSIKDILSSLIININIGGGEAEVSDESEDKVVAKALKPVEKKKPIDDAAALSKELKSVEKPEKAQKKPSIDPEPLPGGIRETLKNKDKGKGGWMPLSSSLRG
jgi:hypothetical protein